MTTPPSQPPPQPPSPLPSHAGVTALLLAWGAGDRRALDALLPVVYAELRRQAGRAMRREAPGHTLQTTALVHEVYLRLVGQDGVEWRNRAQFYGVGAQCMRRVLVGRARARRAAEWGGGAHELTLVDADEASASSGGEGSAIGVLALHEVLERLAALDPGLGRLVELRYFAGLSIGEAAAALGVSRTTVKREWSAARAWLRRELGAP